MILAVPLLTQDFPSLSFKVNGGGIEENQVKTGEKITAFKKHPLFDKILSAPGSKWGCPSLIFYLFTKKTHPPIEVMQRQIVDPLDQVIPVPFVTGSVRARNEKPMKHREEKGSFHIKLELPL
jgi:hypothetical protein